MNYIKKNIFFMSVIAVSVIAGVSFIFASTTTQKDILKISQGSVIVSLAQVVSTSPQLPETFDTTYSLPTGGTTYAVHQGDNLQAVIDKANLGDVIVLDAGATFRANFPFKLPNKNGSGWIYIISSELASLPEGQRVNPANSSHMPKLIALDDGNGLPVLRTTFGAHNYRLAGIEFMSENVKGKTNNLVLHGYGLKNESTDSYWTKIAATTLDELPNNIVYDRCYFHSVGDTYPARCGLMGDGKYIAVIDSYLSNFHDSKDAQAINVWAGPGPYKIVNNYLEATGENFMAGGTDPNIANVVPSDIEFRGNYCKKPLEWRVYTTAAEFHVVKNLFELKNAQRVLVEGNIFENSWLGGQTGRAIVLKACNQSGTANWSKCWDVTFRNNIIKNANGGITLVSSEHVSGGTTEGMKNILIENNLVDLTSADSWVGGLYMFSLSPSETTLSNVVINHNTMLGKTTTGMLCQISPSTFPGAIDNILMTNNIWTNGVYGFKGDGKTAGTTTMDFYLSNYGYNKNLLVNSTGAGYPAGNFSVMSVADVGFLDSTNGNYSFAGNSKYKNQGTDGKDLGVDFGILQAATAHTINGGGSPSAPPNNPPPVIVSPSPSPSPENPPVVSPSPSPETSPTATSCKDLSDMSKYIPTYTGLELTYDVSKLNNFSDFLIKKLNIAEIQFLDKLSLIHTDTNGCYQPININSATQLSDKKVKIDSTNYPELDKKARIKFYNVNSAKTVIMRDGKKCIEPDCKIISYDANTHTLIIEVKGF